jgi:UDP-N-acetylmuramyl pentapeptide phosphotransferase/UDP-N-acetylglucosamine-1-phosphate transferase
MSALQVGAAGAAFAIAFAAVQLLLARFARFALDHPNERSLHAQPVPRTGGIAVLAGACVSFFVDGNQVWLPLVLALGLAALSFADDLRPLPAAVRLAAHLAAAAIVVWFYLAPISAWQALVLVVGIGWLTNLYNFMDGSDGLAGGMSVIGFGAYALAANGPVATVSLCIAAASAAFVVFNFHPARIFLGDVGSIPLGFLAGALGIVGWRDDAWPLWFPLLVFAPFIADATVTLVRRALRGERVWHAHREHFYQRMVRSGLGHAGTAGVAYGAMALCAASALWMVRP